MVRPSILIFDSTLKAQLLTKGVYLPAYYNNSGQRQGLRLLLQRPVLRPVLLLGLRSLLRHPVPRPVLLLGLPTLLQRPVRRPVLLVGLYTLLQRPLLCLVIPGDVVDDLAARIAPPVSGCGGKCREYLV